jgi:hypothetical protein
MIRTGIARPKTTVRQLMPDGGLPDRTKFVIGITHDHDGKLPEVLGRMGLKAGDVCFLRVEEGNRSWRLYSTHGDLTIKETGEFTSHHSAGLHSGMIKSRLAQKRLKIKGVPLQPMHELPKEVICVGDFSNFLNPDRVIRALDHLFKERGVQKCEFVDYSVGH